MKRQGNLFEQVVSFKNLMISAKKAFRGKKRKARVALFYFNLENELLAIENELRSGIYQPLPYRTFEIYEPKKRNICAADFRDRVVHHAICNVIEPIFNKGIIFDSYACRKGKGTHAAVKRAQLFAGHFAYFLKCDVKKYFESVDHLVLKNILTQKLKDFSLLDLLFRIIDHPIPGGKSGKGLPIGNLTSQLFANIYLGELDHFIKKHLRIKGYIRYMDDILIFSSSKHSLHCWLYEIQHRLAEHLQLNFKQSALVLAPVNQGIPFLGFRIFPRIIRLNQQNRRKFIRRIIRRTRDFQNDKIDQTFYIRSISSMIAHISHANTYRLRKKLFA